MMACDRCRRTDRLSDAAVKVIIGLTGANDDSSEVVSERLWLCYRCLQTFHRRWRKFKQERMKT